MKSTSKQNVALGLIALAIIAGIGWYSLRGTSNQTDSSDQASAELSKSAGVLSSTLFDDEKTRAAYQTAEKTSPKCSNSFPVSAAACPATATKTICFVSRTSTAPAVRCVRTSRLGTPRKMHDQGMSIAQIQENIKAKYSHYQGGD